MNKYITGYLAVMVLTGLAMFAFATYAYPTWQIFSSICAGMWCGECVSKWYEARFGEKV